MVIIVARLREPPATRFRFYSLVLLKTFVFQCCLRIEPPTAGCGSPVETSAAGRSTDRAGRRDRLTEPRYEVLINPTNPSFLKKKRFPERSLFREPCCMGTVNATAPFSFRANGFERCRIPPPGPASQNPPAPEGGARLNKAEGFRCASGQTVGRRSRAIQAPYRIRSQIRNTPPVFQNRRG